MPTRPNLLERLLFRLNRAPEPVLDLFGAGAFEALVLASDLGVLDALAGGERPLPALAADLDLDPDALAALLGFLDAQGYVESSSGRYRLAATTRRWLTDERGTNLLPWFAFWRDVVLPFWREHLETALREGEPPLTLYEYCDAEPGRWETAQRGFRAVASLLVEDVAAAVDVPAGATRLLDVGGGHGLYAVELLRRHPGLAATVVDRPEALDPAREEAERAGVADRVELRGADYTADDLGDGYDLALLFNVVHAHDAAETVRLFERVAGALRPGGRVAVLDQFEGSARTPVGRTGLGFVDLTYRVTLGTGVHRREDVAAWLRAAGFERVERESIRTAGPGNALVEATRVAGVPNPRADGTGLPTGSR